MISKAPQIHLWYETSSIVPSVRTNMKHRAFSWIGCWPTYKRRARKASWNYIGTEDWINLFIPYIQRLYLGLVIRISDAFISIAWKMYLASNFHIIEWLISIRLTGRTHIENHIQHYGREWSFGIEWDKSPRLLRLFFWKNTRKFSIEYRICVEKFCGGLTQKYTNVDKLRAVVDQPTNSISQKILYKSIWSHKQEKPNGT